MPDQPYRFLELDAETRALMTSELDLDITQHGSPYAGSGTLTPKGEADYPDLLRSAIASGSEVDLVASLRRDGRESPDRVDNALRLGRSEFNRYYIRAICRRATAHGTTEVVVYRARESESHRSGSDELVGTTQSAPRILASVRASQGGDAATGIGRVNSGITVRCGCVACLAVGEP